MATKTLPTDKHGQIYYGPRNWPATVYQDDFCAFAGHVAYAAAHASDAARNARSTDSSKLAAHAVASREIYGEATAVAVDAARNYEAARTAAYVAETARAAAAWRNQECQTNNAPPSA